ncbi:hypothetical protein JW859_04745 [bacterium]|nr:hypothetical protein [bacterium]
MDNLDAPHAAPATGNRYFWLSLVLGGLLTLLLYMINVATSILSGILLVFIYVLLALPKRERNQLIIFASVVAVLAVIALPNYIRTGCRPPSVDTKANLHAIQLSVERYAIDHDGYYPLDLETVKAEGYLDRLPKNPYIQKSYWGSRIEQDQQQMVNLAGQGATAKQHPLFASGNFVYVPELVVIDSELRATGYELYGLGGEPCRLGITDKERPTFVILSLGSDVEKRGSSPISEKCEGHPRIW